MRRAAIVLTFSLFLLLPNSVAAAECQFVLGFATLRDLIGHDIVGECLENEHYNHIGDSVQQTTGGLLVWRKADNWTAFTDGYRTWINGPNGLVQRLNTERFAWEADYAPSGGIATPTPIPTPPPTPTPDASALAERAIQDLPWVKDGLTHFFEQWTFDHLWTVSEHSPKVFWELMQKPWIQSNTIRVNDVWLAPLFENIASIVRRDPVIALNIARMPFMDTLGFGAEYTWKSLNDIHKSDPEGLQRLLAHPMLRDGIYSDHAPLIPLLYLEQRDPDSAAAIRSMPWRSEELWAVEELRRLAVASQPAFWAWMELFAEEPLDRAILEGAVTIVRIDKDLGEKILNMPFLKTKEHGSDSKIMRQLSGLAWRDPAFFRQVLSHPKLQGGITDDHRSTLDLVILASKHPDAAAAIEALPWVRDGVSRRSPGPLGSYDSHPIELEEDVVHELVRIGTESQVIISVILSKAWIQDGIDIGENRVVSTIREISASDEDAARHLLAMPFLESIEGHEHQILEPLRELLSESEGLHRALSHPRLAGGISDDQSATVALLVLERQEPELAESLWALPWIRNGIAASETTAVFELLELARESRSLFQVLAAKRWLQDDFTAEERTAARDLNDVFARIPERQDQSLALRIAAMPFLNTFEPLDAGAVKSLRILHGLEDGSRLEEVLSHPTLRNGIRDEQTTLVAALGVATRLSPELLYTVLDPRRAIVEKRTLIFPGSSDVTLGVVTTSRRASKNMDWLEFAVRTQVDFMGVPFPWSYVSLWVDDKAAEGAPGGAHETGHLHSGYYKAPGIVAHEVAHLYWRFGTNWITEGGAQLMDTVSENKRIGSRIHAIYSGKCKEAKTIAQLETIRYERSLRGEHGCIANCDHALGAGIFVSLYRALGEDRFREGFRRLYLMLRDEEHNDVCLGLERNICYVRFAFVTDAQPQAARIALPVINRWYYGSERGL